MRRTVALIAAFALLGGCAGATTESASNPVVEPSSAGAEQPTPTISAAPSEVVFSFDEIKLAGKGKKVEKFTIPEGAAAIAVITHKGEANFIVHTLDANGELVDGLVNAIGNYSGTVLIDARADEHSAAFEIDADGVWTITVKPVSSADSWDLSSGQLKGAGDSVYQITPPSSGLVTLDLTYKGEENFIVHSYSSEGSEGLANEIGNFSGQVPLPNGSFLLEVLANGGTWTITPG